MSDQRIDELVGLLRDTFPDPAANGAPADPPAFFAIDTLEEFAAVDEPGARELVGEPGQALIPQGANVMVYGDGGAGKTTLCIDLACHFAAGDNWIGIQVADCGRSLMIEDEGPRPFFRRKIAHKLEAWDGSPLDGRVRIVSSPWAAFTFADQSHRDALTAAIDEHGTDIVFVGPVVVAGMHTAGTLQDVREFLALVDDVRGRTRRRDVTFVLVHHENKGGEVSGAWEGAGDTLIHLNAQGHGKTRLHIQKARQAPDYHLKTLVLEWADGDGYTVDKKEEITEDDLEAKILAQVALDPGVRWSTVENKIEGVRNDRARAARDRLLATSAIVNISRRGKLDEAALAYVEERKTTSLHLADDPSIHHLLPARRAPEDTQ